MKEGDWELGFIEANLLSGKVLILPPSLYDKAIALCKEKGFSDEAMKNIHVSKMLPYSPLDELT